MEAAGQIIRQPWIWAFSLLIFFFNNFLFIEGMTLTLLFTPLWVYLLNKWQTPLVKFIVYYLSFFLLYAAIHFTQGANVYYYLISSTLLCATAIFIFTFYKIVSQAGINLDSIFRDILILNFLLTLFAIVLLWFPSVENTMWYVMSISENIAPMPRLKMFTSEASHYSFLWTLPAIYFYSRIIFFKVHKPVLTLIMVSLPLMLSFSLGVLVAVTTAGVLMLFIFQKNIFYRKSAKKFLIYGALIFLALLLALLLFYPENPLFLRIQNVLQNKDTSARGRTYESFILAHKIISGKSLLWGIGPGQLKLEARNIIIQYYSYTNIPSSIRIPNACAETIVSFGYVGFALRILIEAFLFVKTEVFKCPFRLWLFLFLFIYQFTGSYITNVSEYMLWTISFAPFIFPDFKKAVANQFKLSAE